MLAVLAGRGVCGGSRPRCQSGACDTARGAAGGLGIGPAGKPPGVHLPHVVGHSLRFFHLSRGRGLGLLLRQLTRMHHDKAHLFLHDPLLTILHLHRPHDALPMPGAGRFRLGSPWFLD